MIGYYSLPTFWTGFCMSRNSSLSPKLGYPQCLMHVQCVKIMFTLESGFINDVSTSQHGYC